MKNAKYKVLLIEDDKLDQKAFERLVETEELPYDYKIAGSTSEAQKILACQQFDIVISDYFLGDGTAFNILESVKDIPTIVVTGAGGEEIAVKAWRTGAYDYLIKDIKRSYLKALPITVENAIRHKRTEEKLRLLSGAIMSTVDSVYITDINSKITFVNKAFCDTYGYTKEDVLGKDSSVLWLAGSKTTNTRAVFRTQGLGSTWEVGFYHRRKDGSIFPVSLSRSIIKDSNGNKIAVVGTVRDITEHILVEDELRKTNLKLNERNQLKSELTIKVLEELKKLITNENIVAGPAQETDAWENLNNAKRIINYFLDILEIDTGKIKLQPTEHSLSKVISEIIEALSEYAEKKDIELKSIMPDSELIINGEREKIVQALTCLMSNSINRTPAKGHIEVRLKDIGNEIVVELLDDGPTVEGSKIDKILNDFEWIKELSYSCPQQDALGLVVAKKIVEMHGGYISMESTDASGGNHLYLSLTKSSVREKISMAVQELGI